MNRKIDDKIAQRFERITEEFQEKENLLFFSSFNPMNCPLCDYYYADHPIFLSFEDLIYHIDIRHENEEISDVLLTEEIILQEFLAKKIEYEKMRGRFSN